MSEIKVNKISPRSGTTLTLGDSGDDFVIPAGATLTNNGTASGFASIAWQSTIVTGTTLSAVAGNGYWIDTTSNACTITLPASASVGDQIILVDYDRTWNTNNLTIDLNGLNYQGGTDNPVYDTNGQTVNIVYSGATNGWIPISDDDVADEGTIPPYSAEYLVVAGGASGGRNNSGGGGAGGLLTNYTVTPINLTIGVTYAITVGAGGATKTVSGRGNDGNDSVISGTGISTITALGGGGGGANTGSEQTGANGGSGGGGAHSGGAGGSGTVGQGNDGGTGAGNLAPEYGGGGGGGASAVGGNGTGSNGGDGGNGSSNSITGSAVTYAGGGGGYANNTDGNGGTGGTGGGGDGKAATAGEAGTANTGGGGGGSNSNGGAGGSGVVILRVATADYSGTTTGSPTVTTDGTDTIIKFTGTGTYTA